METLSKLRSGEMAGCKRLDLSCGLTEFPREILSGNHLSELPGDFARLRKLRILFCSDNDFTRLPAVLGECAELEMVGFKANRIETIDPGAFPVRLRWLILTDNRLENLPPSIGKCGRLQKLMLAGNRLAHLPDEMAACRNLELVRLAANRFEEFPPWLFELPALAWLALGGNPWAATPETASMEEIDWRSLDLGELLGEGASGVIQQAGWMGKEAAVKVFKGGMTSDGLPDCEMTACLVAGDHPNLIGSLGRISNHPDGRHGLLMPLVDPDFKNLAGPPDFDSCTRDVYPADLRFDLTEVARAALDLASAVRHLHARGVMHGDFYAHNILRNGAGNCLLGDFGAASLVPQGAAVERIEVRAFGVLLGELLERMEGHDSPELRELQKRCVSEVVARRPDFREIATMLEEIAR
jgi:hypothetical protein